MLTFWSTNDCSESGGYVFIVDISYDLAFLAKFGKISQGSNRRTRRRSDIFRSANSGRRIWSKIQTKHRISNALSRTVGKSRRHARARAAFRRELLAVAQHRPGIAPPIGLHDRGQAFVRRKIVLRHPDPEDRKSTRLNP